MNPIVRLVRHNRKFTLLLALVVVATAVLAISLFGGSGKDKPLTTSPSISPIATLSPAPGSPVPTASGKTDGLSSVSPGGTDKAGTGSAATVSPKSSGE